MKNNFLSLNARAKVVRLVRSDVPIWVQNLPLSLKLSWQFERCICVERAAVLRTTIGGLVAALFAWSAAAQSIQTGAVTGTLCGGSQITVPYHYTGPSLGSGNQFIVELSDAGGSFVSAQTIGSLSTTTLSDYSVDAVIPVGITQGTGYLVRVVSTNPVVTGSPCDAEITLHEVFAGSYVFHETIGVHASGASSVANHAEASGFSSGSLQFQGTGSAVVTAQTPLSNGYSDASGGANVRLGSGQGSFIISGINTSGLNRLSFALAIKKNSAGSNGNELSIDVSSDGTSWAPLVISLLDTGGGTNNKWFFRIAQGTIPSTPNLRIRISHNGGSHTYHLDDFQLGHAVEPAQVELNPAGPVMYCTGQSAALAVTDVPGAVFEWKQGTTTISTDNTAAVDASGNYTVNVSDLFGCRVTRGPVVVNAQSSFTPSVSIDRSPAGTICSGTPVVFSATPGQNGLNPTFQWQKNGVNVGVGASYTDSNLAHNDQVRVIMTTHLSCAITPTANSSALTVPVIQSVTPSVTVTASPGLTVCPGMDISFTANEANGGSSPVYQWKKNGVNAGSNSPLYTAVASAQGDIIEVVMTGNATCRTADHSVSSPSVIQLRQPMGMVTSGAATVCEASSNHQISLFVVGTGTVTGTLNPGGIPFSGMAPHITVPIAPSGTTTYTIAGLQDQNCHAQNLMGSTTISVIPAIMYYEDSDGDGFGKSDVTMLSCSGPPQGYVSLGGDCDDSNADVNPGADEWPNGIDDNCDGLIDEGTEMITWFRDADGDGYGDFNITATSWLLPPVGYVSNSMDCNDNNPNIHPGAVDICGNGIDDNCNGIIDEGCAPVNDELYAAQLLISRPYGQCQIVTGTLSGATVSTQPGVPSGTGEDVWYYFVAQTMAARIACTISDTNVLLELHTQSGSLVASENSNPLPGSEILVWTNLIAGQTYFIRVRTADSSVGAGNFGLCVNHFRRSRFQSGGATLTLCQQIKCEFVQAVRYTFRITPLGGGSTITHHAAPNTTTATLSAIPGIEYNASYTVAVDAWYDVHDVYGQPTAMAVPSNRTWTFQTGNHSFPQLRSSDLCPASLAPGGTIAASSWVCGATHYEFEFTAVSPESGQPVVYSNNSRSRFFNMGSASLTTGVTYNVRIRPIFGAVPGSWGNSYQCIRIAGTLSMDQEEEMPGEINSIQEPVREAINLYPNPSATGNVQLLFTTKHDDPARVEIIDLNGRICRNIQVAVRQDAMNTLPLDVTDFAVGTYFVRVIQNGMTLHEKLILTN